MTDLLTRLHTDGRYIKNAYGRIVNLRGVGMDEANRCQVVFGRAGGGWGEDFIANSFNLLKGSGANCMRIAVNSYSYMGVDRYVNGTNLNCIPAHIGNTKYAQSIEEYRSFLDTLIAELSARDIYCFIDPHSLGTMEPAWWQDFVDNWKYTHYIPFLKDITQRYIDEPAFMGILIHNEPRQHVNDYPYEGYWWDHCLEVAREIHSVNPNLLVLVSGTEPVFDGIPNWCGTYTDWGNKGIPDQFTLNPLPEPNIVYANHTHIGAFYKPLGEGPCDWINNYMNRNNELARQQFEAFLYKRDFRASVDFNMPIMNVECSISRKGKDVSSGLYLEQQYDYLVVANDYLSLMNKYGQHWTYWPWEGTTGSEFDYSPESGRLVYRNPEGVWDRLTYIGEVWKANLAQPKPSIPSIPSIPSWLLAIPIGLILLKGKKKR